LAHHFSIRSVIFIKKALRHLWWLMTLRNGFWARELADHHVQLRQAAIAANGDLYVESADLSLPKSSVSRILLANFDQSVRLRRAGVSFDFRDFGRPIVDVDGIRFLLSYAQDLNIIEEVFLDRIYDVAVQEAAVVVDIGMNVAVASLFFARNGFQVFAYEPFGQTFKRAQKNLALNPQLSRQVLAYQFGLGRERRVVETAYCAKSSPACGLFTGPQSFKEDNEVISEAILIESVCEVLGEILGRVGSKTIIMKIDCEGSEYEIMQALESGTMLHCVSVFLIEWHRLAPFHDPSKLVEILLNGGFVIFIRGDFSKEAGMIIAVSTRRG